MNTMSQSGYLASLQSRCPQHKLDEELRAAIEEDIEMRHPGVTGGLYPIDSLSAPRTSRKFGVPTIACRVHHISVLADNDETFRRRFGQYCPALIGFDLKRYGMCLAGGAVCELMKPGTAGIHDFDLFLVGHTEETARKAIEALRMHVARFMDGKIYVYRTQGCITFQSHAFDPPIQVILRLYSTNAEIIHSFDLGSSSILWDGEKVWMTALGRLAMQYGANVLNLRARRASLEPRIERYFKRGFDLVLPELDVAMFNSVCRRSTSYWTSLERAVRRDRRLPYLTVSREVIPSAIESTFRECACVIDSFSVKATRPELNDEGRPMGLPIFEYTMFSEENAQVQAELIPRSEYTFEIAYGDHRHITLRNAQLLGQDEVKIGGLCAWSGDPACDLFSIQPKLDIGQMTECIEECLRRAWVQPLIQLFGRAGVRILGNYLQYHDTQAVIKLAELRIAELNRRAVIPFAFMRVEDNVALASPNVKGDDDRTTGETWSVTPLQWYGAAYRPVNAWRELLGATIILARLGVTPYEALWVLQWAEPSILALSEARVLRLLERVCKSVMK